MPLARSAAYTTARLATAEVLACVRSRARAHARFADAMMLVAGWVTVHVVLRKEFHVLVWAAVLVAWGLLELRSSRRSGRNASPLLTVGGYRGRDSGAPIPRPASSGASFNPRSGQARNPAAPMPAKDAPGPPPPPPGPYSPPVPPRDRWVE